MTEQGPRRRSRGRGQDRALSAQEAQAISTHSANSGTWAPESLPGLQPVHSTAKGGQCTPQTATKTSKHTQVPTQSGFNPQPQNEVPGKWETASHHHASLCCMLRLPVLKSPPPKVKNPHPPLFLKQILAELLPGPELDSEVQSPCCLLSAGSTDL